MGPRAKSLGKSFGKSLDRCSDLLLFVGAGQPQGQGDAGTIQPQQAPKHAGQQQKHHPNHPHQQANDVVALQSAQQAEPNTGGHQDEGDPPGHRFQNQWIPTLGEVAGGTGSLQTSRRPAGSPHRPSPLPGRQIGKNGIPIPQLACFLKAGWPPSKPQPAGGGGQQPVLRCTQQLSCINPLTTLDLIEGFWQYNCLSISRLGCL